MKPQYTHIFTPIGGTWKSYRLKHWHGKRVNYRGRHGKIVASKHDRDLNFLYWQVRIPGEDRYVNLNDPNYSPRH